MEHHSLFDFPTPTLNISPSFIKDDANAGDDDFDREGREEDERKIQEMLDRAAESARAARDRAKLGEFLVPCLLKPLDYLPPYSV